MQLDRIHPQFRTAISRQPHLDLERRLIRVAGRLGPRLIRWPRVADVRIGRDRIGGVRVRTYDPASVRDKAHLVWIHGGGMVIGAPPMDDLLCSQVAADLGIRVVSVDYRLAPEHPFPAPLDDCLAVVTALAERLGPTARIAVGGQSAGGGLAAALVQHLHDTSAVAPVAQWLFSPMLDDRTAADRSLDGHAHRVWDNRQNLVGWSAMLPIAPGSAVMPEYASPARRVDLSGLPPTWIGVGDIDLFAAEDLAYAARLDEAGVDITTDVVEGAPHGFESIVPNAAVSVEYRLRAISWLGARLRD